MRTLADIDDELTALRDDGPDGPLEEHRAAWRQAVADLEEERGQVERVAVAANLGVPWVEVDRETAYGSTVRLTRSVRVF